LTYNFIFFGKQVIIILYGADRNQLRLVTKLSFLPLAKLRRIVSYLTQSSPTKSFFQQECPTCKEAMRLRSATTEKFIA